MKTLIIALWIIGMVCIAIAAALNPFADSSNVRYAGYKVATKRWWFWQIVICLVGLGAICLVMGGAVFFFDVWITIR